MKLVLSLCLAFLCAAAAAATPVAMEDGEALRYRVRWGLFGNAGEITVSAFEEESAGLRQIRITTHTNTRGFIRNLYLFDGDGECIFDARDGRLLAIKTWSTTTKKSTKTMAVFDYQKNVVNYVDYIRTDKSAELPMPPENPMDLITCLVQTRRWDLKPGESSTALVMFEKEFYELVVVAEAYEQVRTPMGEFRALRLVPMMEEPKGMFKRGGRVRVWIAQDDRRLPVKFEVAMKYGTGTALLTEYRPPDTTAPVAYANPGP